MAQPGRSPEVDAELKKLQGVQNELQTLAASRSQFYQQANENGMVKQELDLLEDDAPVFKLIGPVLMKQDLEEAKQNVAKRLELIEREMAKVSKAFEEKQKEEAAIGDERPPLEWRAIVPLSENADREEVLIKRLNRSSRSGNWVLWRFEGGATVAFWRRARHGRSCVLTLHLIMRIQGGMKERAAEEARKIMQGAA